MKKGYSFISYDDTSIHPLIQALKNKGLSGIELIYTSSSGWDMVKCDKNLIGWDGWLGFTKKGALRKIERIEVREEEFLYLN